MFTNNCLPKYFYGDIMNQDEHSDKNCSEDVHLSEPNLSSIPSPSSSLASTKKLEWDSGADIGYNIYDSVKKSRKSKSYPSLNMDLQISKSKDTATKPTIHSSSNGAKNVQTLACIGEGDSLRLPKNKKPKSFKHSTPYDHKQTLKSCINDGPNEKATSPISIQELRDECLQTTLIHKSSKEVQTEFEIIDRKQIEDKSLQTDVISDILLPQSMSSSSSKSGSFKYIPGSEIEQLISNNNNSQTLSNGTIKSGVTLKSSSYSTSSRRDETESGSCSPLGQMISTQYSKHLIDDIDKSLGILQKFIKSKNYSNETKKHYAKKIVTKIITNKYSEDTESSLELKTLSSSNQEDLPKDKSISINTNTTKSNKSIDKKYVECGIQCEEINRKSQIISDRNDCNIKESLKKLNALQTDLKNWRDAQTLSEKLFEARKTHKSKLKKSVEHSSGSSVVEGEKRDYLIQHSKNERKRQLSWINNEISYLQKLKELLQLNEQSQRTSTSSSLSTRKTDSSKQENSFHALDECMSNLAEVERKFNEEFGLLCSDCKTQDVEKVALDKLSKFLTNEQIKFILDHDVHRKPESETKVNLSSSYNSHRNSIYGGGGKKRTQQQQQQTSPPEDIRKTSSSVNAATQCTISKKSDSDSDYSDGARNIEIEIVPKAEQAYTSSEYDESVIVEKENLVKRVPQYTKKMNKGGTAYFLTFEEESQSEFDQSEERKVLDQVVVKIPKYHRSSRKLKPSDRSDKSELCPRTLEEYLVRNKPNFVRTANWRWSQVRSVDSQDKHNLFTCHEMKEMSKKKYKNLPEIQEKAKNSKTQLERMHNRFMANIFSKKLQKKTLQGHICLATCKDVMASE